MWKILLNPRLSSLILIVKRSVSVQSNFDLGKEMKSLNDAKQFQKALQLFDRYKKNNMETFSSLTITQALKACAHLKDLQRGSTIHQLVSSRIKDDSYISTSLIQLYIQCGDVTRAQSLFDTARKKTLSMYGAMMKGYIKNKQAKEAIDLFSEIKDPDEVILIFLFNACAHLESAEALNLAKKVYEEMPKSFQSNSYILTSLLDVLMKCGDVSNAQLLFKRLKNKELSMYGAMMKGYIKNNQANEAIALFNEIQKPNEVMFNLFFNACAELETVEALNAARKVYQEMPKSFQSNTYILTSLLDVLMKCGNVSDAQLLFDRSTKKELSMYGAMMKGYLKNNQANKAIGLFNEIRNPSEVNLIVLFNACAHLGTAEALSLVKKVWKGIPKSFYSNSRLLTSLLDALIKCGDCSSAETLFPKTKNSVENYGNLMNGFNKENNPFKTLNLFNQMKKNGIEANLIIYLIVIKALSQLGDYDISQSIVKEIPNSCLSNDQIQTALIDMWSKNGNVDRAKEIFEKISQPDQVGYNTMINCYGLNGMGIQAIEVYRQVPENYIDEVTYVCILNACSHSGLVDEARSIFRNIQIKTESIYCTMIDCLSRASFFEEAQELIDDFERYQSPVLSMYMALLSGARNVNNSHLSQNLYDRMKKLFPHMSDPLKAAAVLLTNVYTSSGEVEKASGIKIELHESGGKKKSGLTWTAPNGQIYKFRAHDRSHPQTSEIYAEGKKISQILIEHGHRYDASWITRPLNEDETVESVLCGHSERLALAWNFVVNPNTSRIQMVKNLRMCGDCHRTTKLIAAIRKCEIIVRDANRIHHFHTNGQCSCNDYF